MQKYEEYIYKFWEDTETDLISATKKMEQDWQAYIMELADKLNNYDVAVLEKCVT